MCGEFNSDEVIFTHKKAAWAQLAAGALVNEKQQCGGYLDLKRLQTVSPAVHFSTLGLNKKSLNQISCQRLW